MRGNNENICRCFGLKIIPKNIRNGDFKCKIRLSKLGTIFRRVFLNWTYDRLWSSTQFQKILYEGTFSWECFEGSLDQSITLQVLMRFHNTGINCCSHDFFVNFRPKHFLIWLKYFAHLFNRKVKAKTRKLIKVTHWRDECKRNIEAYFVQEFLLSFFVST
jgi:hypothetical protein